MDAYLDVVVFRSGNTDWEFPRFHDNPRPAERFSSCHFAIMKTPTTPESRGPKLKQAQLPFARTPPAPHPRPAEATPPAPPAKKPRLDVPRISSPVLLDDDSVESITCEPVICPKSDESEGKVDPDSTLNESALTSDPESELDKSAPLLEQVNPSEDKNTPNTVSSLFR